LPEPPPPVAHRPCPFGRLALPTASPLPCSLDWQVQEYLPVRHRLRLLCVVHKPRLRTRLTLGRLPWPRNPQAFGVAGSHRQLTRYSFRHSHFGSLHGRSRSRFSAIPERSPTKARRQVLACPRRPSAASGPHFSPVTLSAQCHSTSELLRTLSRMAASKPTSWLSVHHHNLSHSVWIWGP
jgi:hypothetical protein